MPDRLPPHWGHEPEDGRDLDALLSVEEILTDEALLAGQLAGISDSQRPVAGAMFALRAAPAGSELAGEAAARAAFRALIEPAGPEVHHTLVLPVPAQGQGPRPPARHRHRRRAAGRRGWHVMALVGSAAAVVAIGAAALAGTFGSAGHRGQSANPSASHQTTQPGASPTVANGVLGHATKDATPSTTPKASTTPGATASPNTASQGSALCREYFSSRHPVGKARKELFRELSQLAGTDQFWGVVDYCNNQDANLFRMPPKSTADGKWRFPGSGIKGGLDSGAKTDKAGSSQGKASGSGSGGSQ